MSSNGPSYPDLPDSLKFPLSIGMLLLAWMNDELPLGVEITGPNFAKDEKAAFIYLITTRPEKGGTWGRYIMAVDSVDQDALLDLFSKLSSTVMRAETREGYTQFNLLSRYRLDDDDLQFSLGDPLISELNGSPDIVEALHAGAAEVLARV